MLNKNPASRTALLAQLSAHPWALDPRVVTTELASLSTTSIFDALFRDLSNGPEQTGPTAIATGRIVIGWGRHDRLRLPRQAARAKAALPSADVHWFDSSGHFPIWDMLDETVAVIPAATPMMSYRNDADRPKSRLTATHPVRAVWTSPERTTASDSIADPANDRDWGAKLPVKPAAT